MDAYPAESAAAAAQPPLQLEAVVVDTDHVDADAVRVPDSAPLASAPIASTNTVVGSITTDIVERSPACMHLWFVFLFVMLLRDCGACFAAIESSEKPRTLEELNTRLRQLQKLDAAFFALLKLQSHSSMRLRWPQNWIRALC